MASAVQTASLNKLRPKFKVRSFPSPSVRLILLLYFVPWAPFVFFRVGVIHKSCRNLRSLPVHLTSMRDVPSCSYSPIRRYSQFSVVPFCPSCMFIQVSYSGQLINASYPSFSRGQSLFRPLTFSTHCVIFFLLIQVTNLLFPKYHSLIVRSAGLRLLAEEPESG
jgi:hypothetical protein